MTTRISRIPNIRGRHALSVFDLDYIDGQFVTIGGNDHFNPKEYSEFKYGNGTMALNYASNITTSLMPHLWAMSDYDEPFVVTGTPYKRIPNAARVLALETFKQIRRSDHNASYASIYQPRLACGDYGTLNQEQRHLRNNSKKRYLDPDDFTGKHVILIDDIRITGSIEQSTVAMLQELDVLSITTVNLVKLNPETAANQPHLEDRLNHCKIRGLADLWHLMLTKGEAFVLTTRALKYILQADEDELASYLKLLSLRRLSELYQGIVEEGYDQMAVYRRNFEHVLTALHH